MNRSVPTGSAAAALMLLALLVLPAAGDLVSDIGVIPNPFSPNADGAFDSTAVYYTLSEPADVVISIGDSLGAGIWTLWAGREDAGTRSHWWDGVFRGAYVDSAAPDADYHFLIKAIPDVGEFADEAFRFTVDTVPPALAGFEIAPSRFSPDGDGVGDSLHIAFSVDDPGPSDQVAVRVLSEDDSVLRQVYSATGVDEGSVYWDGTDDSGGAVPDGLVFVQIETRDAAGNTSFEGALADLDTAAPELGVDFPDTLLTEVRVATTTAGVTGWAFDRAGVVAVELSLDGESWIETTLGRSDTVDWQADVECVSCVPESLDETMEVLVRGRDGTPTADGLGHVNGLSSGAPVLSFDVVFDVAPPLHESTTIMDDDSVYLSGETITISTRWDDVGYGVTADFSGVDSEFDPADVEVTESTGGRYTIKYELSDANTLAPVVNAPVAVTAEDYFGRSDEAEVSVTVLEGSGQSAALSVDVNFFRPLDGERATISLGSSEGAATVDVFNMNGTLVRTLETDGASSLSWYGDSDEGDTVASGVYFLRIQTDDGETTKKVAVIK